MLPGAYWLLPPELLAFATLELEATCNRPLEVAWAEEGLHPVAPLGLRDPLAGLCRSPPVFPRFLDVWPGL